ncbi:MAG: glycoside hydrolase family 5 protein [Treponema sp.]|jgi:endoglucanase|nr:glycoside hydrolase family 5 protein [Treponema sp.]
MAGGTGFYRGVNFSTWFEKPSPQEIVFSRFAEQDFKNVKSMGGDVIRLPVKMHSMTDGGLSCRLDPLFLSYLDQAVDWAEQNEIYLILDNHSFHPVNATASDIGKILLPVWTQLAERYKNRGTYIVYEVLNEPHGISAKMWADIQGKAIKAIRKIDRSHSIIAGGVNFNSINELLNVPVYPDDNIIYTFHFYDPHVFTHQGAAWGSPPVLKNLKEVPFPADAHPMPEIPDEFEGTWVEKTLKHSYMQEGTASAMAKQLDKAVAFSRKHGGIPLFCGEFGAYMPNTLPEDRLRWYETATKLLDERNIARASWDYFGGFGLFKTKTGGSFDADLNLGIVKALGFSFNGS